MLGFAIVDRQHDTGTTAVWLTSREGARVTDTNAGVIQHDDETYNPKVAALIGKRAVVLADGAVAAAEFAHALDRVMPGGLTSPTLADSSRELGVRVKPEQVA